MSMFLNSIPSKRFITLLDTAIIIKHSLNWMETTSEARLTKKTNKHMFGIKHVTSKSSCKRLYGWFYERNEKTYELYIERYRSMATVRDVVSRLQLIRQQCHLRLCQHISY